MEDGPKLARLWKSHGAVRVPLVVVTSIALCLGCGASSLKTSAGPNPEPELGARAAMYADLPDVETPLPPPAGGEPNDTVVIVAHERFASLPGIPGGVWVARAWQSHFQRSMGVPATSVEILTDELATKPLVVDALERASAKASPNGRLWLVWIGHSFARDSGNVLLTYEWDEADWDRNNGQGEIPMTQVLEILSRAPSRTVALLDVGRPDVTKVVASESQVSEQMTVLWGSAPREYAGSLPNHSVPAFSYLALGGLRGWADENADSRVSVRELHDFLRSALAGIIRGRSQRPELWGDPEQHLVRRKPLRAPHLSAFGGAK